MSSSMRTATRSIHVRPTSMVVLAVFALVSAGLFAGAKNLVADQEKRLLAERTAEVGTLLSSAVGTSVQSSLSSLGTAAQSPTAFAQVAQASLASGSITTVAVAAQQGSDWVVKAVAGKALAVGEQLTGSRLALVRSAGTKLRSDVFNVPEGGARLAVALGVPGPVRTVAYEEVVVNPSRATPLTQSQPFHELNVALYVSTRADAAKLLLSTTSQVPLRGKTATAAVLVGDDSWLIVAAAREPLAGTLASNVPMILALAMLLIGLAMAGVVESVSRRRDYALTLVDERTAALQTSLGDLEKAQNALVANERLAALGQMAATVGHELRNPLGVLTNSLYLIRNTVSADADDRLRRQLDTADREISAATLIVSDLLEFSRPRAANPTSVDVAALLGEAVSVAPPPAGISVLHDEVDVPQIVVDRDQIRQVILNLLTNAYEAMPEGGTVRITAQVIDHAVTISVLDSGLGMDEQTRAQVFEPFFSSKVKGTGLGLAVSKRIVEKHLGNLTMTSQPGQGCTAVLTLPLTPAEAGVTV
ncbi:MAG: Integral rane sensor signal transduction histidine kinase [Frankiales bacterium]|nr:Integral rane sensor signal transduction histidine kinase [Frankiales bacterium]